MDYPFRAFCVWVFLNNAVHSQSTLTEKIQQDSAYEEFNSKILSNNKAAILKLHYEQVTVFVPVNSAFLPGTSYAPHLIFYHTCYGYKPLSVLNRTQRMRTARPANPPLWVTKRGEDIYINNARIIKDKSNYVARTLGGNGGIVKRQVLHVIDAILDPVIASPASPPTAWHLLRDMPSWGLGAAKTVSNFLAKVQETKTRYAFDQTGSGHTFFLPLDSGFDPYQFDAVDRSVVYGHVVPFYVLFAAPAPKGIFYESLANDDDVYVVLSVEEELGKHYVKGSVRKEAGESGDFKVEIVVANIPVENGVVHLIARPLGIYRRRLRPFPYVPTAERLSADPETDVFYSMGQRTGFNKIFTKPNVSFTYFVPRDSSWTAMELAGFEPVENDLEILDNERPFEIIQGDGRPFAREHHQAEQRAHQVRSKVVRYARQHFQIVRPADRSRKTAHPMLFISGHPGRRRSNSGRPICAALSEHQRPAGLRMDLLGAKQVRFKRRHHEKHAFHPPGRLRSGLSNGLLQAAVAALVQDHIAAEVRHHRGAARKAAARIHLEHGHTRHSAQMQKRAERAVEEDNDDLVPLIATYSPRFTELYGKYYFAEILMNKQLGRHLIVAEHQGSAVAVLCLNKVVNYEVLNDEFELVPYNGLKKPHPKDYEDFDFNIGQSSAEKLSKSQKEEEITAIFEKRSANDSIKADEEIEEVVSHVSYTESDQFSIIFTSASMFVFQDDEDYDLGKKGSQDSTTSSRLLSQYMTSDKDISDREQDMAYEYQSIYSTSRLYLQRIPEFKGEENAFVIEIAAALPNHEEGIMELFDAAFDCIPDRDYCVMAVPPTVPVNKLTRFFTRVPPRASGTFPFELYVMHRNAMLANIEVEEVSKEQETAVKQLLTTIPNHKKVYEMLQDSINDPFTPYSSFVALTDGQIIGLAIVSEERDLEYLMAHYDLSVINLKMYRSGTHGALECLLLSPIFQRYDKYFLREIHRMSEFEILYYKHSAYDSSETLRDRPLMNILFDFLPVMPTMQPQYDMTGLIEAECAPSPTVIEKKESFALYVSTLPLASLERNVVNTRILVLGCSHTALSFLKTLLLKQSPNYMVTFNSVTLLCSVGLIHTRVNPRIRELFLVKKNFLDARYMDCISLKTYVNFIQGKITKLDRRDKYIVINGSQFIDYDTLILMCGEQFQRISRGKGAGQIRPDNVLYLNNVLEANNAILKLKQLYHKHNSNHYKIIIYGHYLQAHTAICGLISYGVPATHLILIEPFPYIMTLEKKQRHNVSIYNDPDIDDVIYNHIVKEGVKIYQSYYFIDWKYDEETNLITSAKFESKHKMLEQECLAMFMFHEKEISPRLYRVLNSAGLVYDGRLVIDAECKTNDLNIFAAGTLTKYSRKYHAPNMTHKFFSRVEVGRRLGIQIRNMLIQQKVRKWSQESAVGWNFHIERGDLVVPKFDDPLMRYCRLPGGIFYLSLIKPGKRMPLETAVSMEHYGQVLITGSCKDITKQGYFRLHLNQYKRVETITCLHVQPIDYYNLYCLWGKHEKLLNNLMLRFEMVLITDLFEYFKQPWVYAIYHEKFDTLMDELNMLMTSSIGSSEESIINVLISLCKKNKWRPLPREDKEYLELKFRSLGYPRIIEQKVLKFIKMNMQHLPMYAHPTIVRKLLDNFNLSALFSE